MIIAAILCAAVSGLSFLFVVGDLRSNAIEAGKALPRDAAIAIAALVASLLLMRGALGGASAAGWWVGIAAALTWIWPIGTALILGLGLAMFIETVWRTRKPLGQSLQEDAWFLSIGFGFSLTWPIVLAGCGACYGVYRLGRAIRAGQRG